MEEQALTHFIESKKLVSLLELGEEQLNLSVFGKKSGVECLYIYFQRLLRDEHELMLNRVLMAQAENNKEVQTLSRKRGSRE